MHIRFTGTREGKNVTKIIPAHMIGLQWFHGGDGGDGHYWVEVFYSKEDRHYEINKKEYNRIARLIEKIK